MKTNQKLEKTLMETTQECLKLSSITCLDHVSNRQLYGNLLPITDVIKERRLRFANHSFRDKNELVSNIICMDLLGTPLKKL